MKLNNITKLLGTFPHVFSTVNKRSIRGSNRKKIYLGKEKDHNQYLKLWQATYKREEEGGSSILDGWKKLRRRAVIMAKELFSP